MSDRLTKGTTMSARFPQTDNRDRKARAIWPDHCHSTTAIGRVPHKLLTLPAKGVFMQCKVLSFLAPKLCYQRPRQNSLSPTRGMAVPILDGIICTSEQYARQRESGEIHCLTRGQSIGLTIVAQTGLLSLLAVLYVFWIILLNIIQHIRYAPRNKWRFFQQPVDVLMFSLFCADIIQAIGAVMDIKWINDGKVEIGGFCTAQGVVQQLGETSVAITTLVIAIYTFIGIWWRKGTGAVFVTKIVILGVWSFIVIMVVVGNVTHTNKRELYQSPTPYWCWIGDNFLKFRILG
ncbi:hypothetical protein BDQ12DRAFT_7840 [Crucibulum laeve]|uniref:Glucose receptor Git3 N-terminal domain-containing protein n=1 Tax=Crucibulum laeve TaxID=68775 RepID=A0A5C3MHV3_9AGAR|nr:hypothetical protein BDQ12DRAFT_7840 [Crucibulum laeve]